VAHAVAPAAQALTTHPPPAHAAVALASAQARRHAPQWEAALRVSASQPFAGSPSQLAQPASQLATAHTDAAHDAVAWGSEHACPQRPQCAAALRVSVSQALTAMPSQSPKPALQV
jgi:hypothetical protein